MARRKQQAASSDGTVVQDAVLTALIPVVEGLGESLGGSFEFVLHDFRRPDSSVVAIHGKLTDRHVGGAMSAIGLEMLRQGDKAEDQINYLLRVNGRTLRSSSIPLRDPEGHVFGALCLNVDVTQFQLALSALKSVVGEFAAPPRDALFSDDIGQVIEGIVRQEEERVGHVLSYDAPHDRRLVIKALNDRGLFRLSSAAYKIADHLGVSRATVYKDLQAAREEANATVQD
jgi:predicted transcriptional regulator YheO